VGILDRVESIAKDTPPIDNAGSRFGNPAFRTFYDKVAAVSSLFPSTISSLLRSRFRYTVHLPCRHP
jgi:serine/threonine-protein phosphatase 2A activator